MVMQLLRSKKFTRRILIALLILIIPAFVLWGAGSLTGRPGLIGSIGSQKIYADDFEKSRQGMRIQYLLSYYGNYDTLMELMKNRALLNYMAWERLILLQAARKSHIRISNTELVNYIAKHPLFQRDGVFSKELYEYILRNTISTTPRDFEELLRQNLQVQTFRNNELKDITVSDEEIVEEYKKNNEKIVLSYVIVYKDFFTPEVSVSEEEIKEVYTQNEDKFFSPVKIDVDYIEFPFENAEEKETMIEKSKNIYTDLKTDPNKIKDIADKEKLTYGQTDYFAQAEVVPTVKFFKGFNDAAFSLSSGQISIPVFPNSEKGAGYIIRRLREIEPKKLSFEQVHEDIKTLLIDRDALELAGKRATELYTKITEEGLTLDKIAPDLNQQVKMTTPFTETEYIENIGPSRDLIEVIRQEGKGSFLSPFITKKGAILAEVDEIMPADMEKLDEQKDAIKQQLLTKKHMEAMKEWFEENKTDIKLKEKLEDL